jgi:Zn-dependent peptidase ImmA (M78 family)
MSTVLPKWAQEMKDRGVSLKLIKYRMEQRKAKDREWALKNKDKKAMHKRAYKARKRGEPLLVTAGVAIKYTYRPNWKEAPVYYCPELTYRGKV